MLHADIRLENSAGLHRAGSGEDLSATVREVVPSLEAKDLEGSVINALRKEVDRRQLEFVKSGKLVPVQFSSRHYDFKRNKWMFGKASEEEIELLLARKVYWQTRRVGQGERLDWRSHRSVVHREAPLTIFGISPGNWKRRR